MPLSDHEQKLLEQMEQQLLADDPRFATTMRDQRRARSASPRRGALGVTAIVAGLVAVVLSLYLGQLWLGGLGIVLMFGGLIVALTGGHPHAADLRGAKGSPAGGGSRAANQNGGFMQRLEQRWDRRRDQGR